MLPCISVLCHLILVTSARGEVKVPDGYMLAMKVVQIDTQTPTPEYYNHASLFKIEFNGSVSQFWNYSYNKPHLMFSENLFAIDLENELVYLGVEDQLLALELSTGEVKINIPLQVPNLQFFWNYDYIPREKAIYGVCTGNSHWNWCRVKLDKPLDHNTIKLEFLYQIPVLPLELGPDEGIYYMDKEHQSIWYYTGITLAYGVNYTTGKLIFSGNGSLYDQCIAHDHTLNRTFSLISNPVYQDTPLLAEIHHSPRNEVVLMTIPIANLVIALGGSCIYDPKTHTLTALMRYDLPNTGDSLMPTSMLLIDVVGLTYKPISLPEFKKWNGVWPITGLKYIPR